MLSCSSTWFFFTQFLANFSRSKATASAEVVSLKRVQEVLPLVVVAWRHASSSTSSSLASYSLLWGRKEEECEETFEPREELARTQTKLTFFAKLSWERPRRIHGYKTTSPFPAQILVSFPDQIQPCLMNSFWLILNKKVIQKKSEFWSVFYPKKFENYCKNQGNCLHKRHLAPFLMYVQLKK